MPKLKLLVKPKVCAAGELGHYIYRLVELDPDGKTPEKHHYTEYLGKDHKWRKSPVDYWPSGAEARRFLKQAA